MIYSPLSSYLRTKELPLSASAVLSQEGQAMMITWAGQVPGVLATAGAATDKFVGFLIAQTSAVPFLQTTAVKTERFTVPAGKTVTLAKLPIASTTFVYNVTGSAAVTPDSVNTTTGVVDLTTGGTVGTTVDITYRYNLTVAEARSRNGDVVPGGAAAYVTNSVSLVQAGVIYTDQFDSSKNYAAATGLKTAANGLITDQSGAGAALTGATVIATPSVDYPFLGIDFSVY